MAMTTRPTFLWILIIFSFSSCMIASPISNADYNDKSRMDIKRTATSIKPAVGGNGGAGSVIGSGVGTASSLAGGSSGAGGGGRGSSSGGSSSAGTGKGSSSSSSGKGGSRAVGAGSAAGASTVAAKNSQLRANNPLTGASGAIAVILVVFLILMLA